MTNFAVPGVRACVRGDHLVLSLPDAVYPVVWQFDISQARSSSIEVLPVEQGYAIRLKTAGGDIQEIAVYTGRDRAVAVLSLIHQTLIQDGKEKPDSASVTGRGNWKLAVATLVLFVILTGLLFSLFSGETGRGGVSAESSPSSTALGGGGPLSAEEVLKGRVP